jgi:membrane protease subunit (stomatin/prohibitin family)
MATKVKSVTIKVNNDYVIWNENIEDIVRDATLIVEPGCVGIYIVDGMLKSVNPAGKWLLKSKEEDKKKASLQLIGVNTEKTFDIRCGTGGVPYKDYEINVETTVGAHGVCKIKISQPWALYTAMGRPNVTVDEIDQYMKMKLGEIMTSVLSEVLQNYDYNTILSQQSEIADKLAKKCEPKLSDIGIQADSFTLAGIKFSEEYQGQRKAFFEAQNRKKEEKQARREKEREQQAEIDNLIAIANATQNLNLDNSAPQAPVAPAQNDINQPVKYCTRCGMKVASNVVFCPGCGQKF